MSEHDDDERTPAAAPVPLWIERSVQAGLRAALGPALAAIEDGCAKREQRIVASEGRVLEAEHRMHALKDEILAAEARLIEFVSGLGLKQLELNQKATEGAQLALSEKFQAEKDESSRWRAATDARLDEYGRKIAELERRMPTEPSPPPSFDAE